MEFKDIIWLILLNLSGIILLWKLSGDDKIREDKSPDKFSEDEIVQFTVDFIDQVRIKYGMNIKGHIVVVPHNIAYSNYFIESIGKLVILNPQFKLNVIEENKSFVKIEMTW